MPGPITCVPRVRNAAATREAMLAAARRHFARESYDNVGLRDIARDAGVDPALVSRYFGSKEALFKEALRGGGKPIFDQIAPEALPAFLASLLLDDDKDAEEHAAKADCLMMLLRSSSSARASEIVRAAIAEDMLAPIARLAGGGADADARAGLALSVLMGSGILRSSMGVPALCSADPERLRARLTALFAAALGD